jgi:hypothetical protein
VQDDIAFQVIFGTPRLTCPSPGKILELISK